MAKSLKSLGLKKRNMKKYVLVYWGGFNDFIVLYNITDKTMQTLYLKEIDGYNGHSWSGWESHHWTTKGLKKSGESFIKYSDAVIIDEWSE